MENRNSSGIPMRPLGKTGEWVTIIGVGGYHIGKSSADLGVRIIRSAIDEGITFMDNSWDYHAGESERIMGRALRDGYRERVFLMTKTNARNAARFDIELSESLQRLQVECIDLLQFHEVVHEGEPQRIIAEGAIEAAIRAREAGKIRFIGFTGHRWPHLLRQLLDAPLAWDTVQMPVNLLDAHYRSFQREVLPALVERGIGVIGMKSLAADQLLRTGVSAVEGIRYALSQPISTMVTGIDSLDILKQNLDMARGFQPLSAEEQQALLTRVASAAADGHLEHYKTRW